MNYEGLIFQLNQVNGVSLAIATRMVNQTLTIRNWLIGAYIVEYEQHGEDRATYGEVLLRNIAKDLSQLEQKGLSYTNLKSFRKFALMYPFLAKSQTVSDFLKSLSESSASTGQTASDLLNTPRQANSGSDLSKSSIARFVAHHSPSFPSLEIRIAEAQYFSWQTPEYYAKMLTILPWSHLVELCRIDDPTKRIFYELETAKSNWSIRELKRQISSLLYERVGLSRDKEAVIAMAEKGQLIDSPANVLRDPYILEFLGLQEQTSYTESQLEQALIDNLQHFMLELGRDFCFVARQFRIVTGSKYYYVDLLFYHRGLRCLIAIDLKLGEFEPSYAGQMNLYLNYLKEEVAYPDENPPVGIIMCADRDTEEVRYSTAGMDNQLFVSRYLVALPSEAKLKQWLHQEQQRLEQQLQVGENA